MSGSLDLNQLGVLEGTDKSSSVRSGWDYLRHYEEWFSPFREQDITLIEIGVSGGNSLQVWRRFFPNALIVGVDIDRACMRFAGERIRIEIGSQDDPVFLQQLRAQYAPDIIIDDGSHLAHHIVYTFEQMFPCLRPGGMYVVEDLDFHFGESARAWAPVEGYDAPQYFLDLARACMTRKNRDELWGTRRAIVRTADSVHFINSAACVRKRPAGKRPVDLEAARHHIAQQARKGTGLLRYAKYMADNGHEIGLLVAELHAIGAKRQDVDVEFFRELAYLERDRGQMRDAIETLAHGAAMFGDSAELLWRYGHWLVEAGRRQDGLGVLGRAATVCRNARVTESIVAMLTRYARVFNEVGLAVEALRRAAEASADAGCRRALLKGLASLPQ